MTRVLVLGAAPLPIEPQLRQYAANLRTWHFARPLLEDGHEIRVVGCRLPGTCPEDMAPMVRSTEHGFVYHSLSASLFQNPDVIQELCDEFDPDAIVGVNTHPASRAVAIDTDKPVWCDLNGWAMAEAQTKTYVYDDDRYLSHFWNMERAVLDRADVISTVSEAQACATIGELAVRGRLGKRNFGYEFVHTIPNAISEVEYEHSARVVRDVLVGEDAFVVLWVGGYNTWTDIDLLYDALTRAMAEVPELCFVSTGGVIAGHDEITFTRFRERVATSPFAGRFHFAGWVPTAEVPSYYFESDLGLNVDSANYETTFGARNRLNDMMKVGLPILTTLGTEISRTLAAQHLSLAAPIGDAAAFAERMVWASRHRDQLRRMAAAARRYGHQHFSYGRTTEPLRRWVREPRRAPDCGEAVRFEDLDFFTKSSAGKQAQPAPEPSSEAARADEAELRYREARRELDAIHASKMWRLWMTYQALRRLLLRPFRRSSA